MALFDMGGRKPVSTQPPMPNVPVQQVASLKQQGLSDNQIIQSLQRDGYKTHQIFDAMNQADLVSGAARPLDEMPPLPPQEAPYQDPAPQGFQSQPMQNQQIQYPQYQPQPVAGPVQFGEPNFEKIEEIAESIIEEKWNDFSKGLSKIIDWKERTELKINELDTRLTELKQSAGSAKGAAQVMISIGAIIGCFIAPLVGGKVGRRPAYFGLCLLSLVLCAVLFRAFDHYDGLFLLTVGAVGCVTAAFYGWMPLYLPELFPTRVRATGQGLSFNFGRIVAAVGDMVGVVLVQLLRLNAGGVLTTRLMGWLDAAPVLGVAVSVPL